MTGDASGGSAQGLVARCLLRLDEGDNFVDGFDVDVGDGERFPLYVRVEDAVERDQTDYGVGVVMPVAVGDGVAFDGGGDRVSTRSGEGTIDDALANLVDEHPETLAFRLPCVQRLGLADSQRHRKHCDGLDGGKGVRDGHLLERGRGTRRGRVQAVGEAVEKLGSCGCRRYFAADSKAFELPAELLPIAGRAVNIDDRAVETWLASGRSLHVDRGRRHRRSERRRHFHVRG